MSSAVAGQGRLVLVATPIGNLGDLAPRARQVLADAALICCEDTRRTRALLSALGIGAGDRLMSLHRHNEAAGADRVAAAVAGGSLVALVSDAGTPGISDPGALVVARLAAQGETVTTVPGPSSVVAAVTVSGLPTDRFVVEGFLPRKGSDRRRRVAALLADERTSVVLEAPGRLASTLEELAVLDPDRPIAVAREMTKLHEEVWRGTAAAGAAEFGGRDVRGEIVLVVGGGPAPEPADDDAVEVAVRAVWAHDAAAGPRQVADRVAATLGVARRRAYEAALRIRSDPTGSGSD